MNTTTDNNSRIRPILANEFILKIELDKTTSHIPPFSKIGIVIAIPKFPLALFFKKRGKIQYAVPKVN
tara:strand:+ start:6151 stop:6354 length:204 start_codon:yes stop_codon:yes gene_type:complete